LSEPPLSEPPQASLVVGPEEAGLRLDRALALHWPAVSRTRFLELVNDGGVRIDGQTVQRGSVRLEEGMLVELCDVPRSRMRTGAPTEEVEPRIVHEDEHLVVVDKPAGMVTHPSTIVRGATLSEWAASRYGELPMPQGEDRPGIVHRLDADTTGLCVLARDPEAADRLLRAFRERKVEKRYLALVHGNPRFDSDWIDAPIGRLPKRPDRMSVVREDADGPGRPAQTFYETLERHARSALIACQPRTGRTHQIRVHLAHIDHPLIGDRVYRGSRGLSLALPRGIADLGRHTLHAGGLAFDHPMTGERMDLSSDPPQDFEALRAELAG
jgi:23S rRNA pseudouridine1911/1915/1917 synthase